MNNINKELPKLLTLNRVSDIWGIPLWTLRKAVQKKQVPHTRRLGRIYIIRKKFEEWLSKGDVDPIENEVTNETK